MDRGKSLDIKGMGVLNDGEDAPIIKLVGAIIAEAVKAAFPEIKSSR